MEENLLLKRLANGDELAFAKIFSIYKKPIYTLAVKLIGDSWHAEEILQDTFLKVWVNRTKLHQLDNFKAWLHTVAKNATYNAIKETQRERKNVLNFATESNTDVYLEGDYLLIEKQYNQLLDQAISCLPPKQKETYILIKQKKYKRQEAALELQVSPETVKYNLDMAIKSIKAYCKLHIKDVLLFLFFLSPPK